MKVKELVAALADADPEAEVVLQKDSEGNGYSPLNGADLDAVYVAETTWSGDVYAMDWSAEDACMTEREWSRIKAKPRCVVLFPVN
jgi:hypothetical protein